MDTEVMQTISTSAGLGAAALDYISEDPARMQAFNAWADAQAKSQFPLSEQVMKSASLACAGLHQLFKDVA